MERETPQGWQRQPMSALGSFIKGRGGPRADDEPQGIPVIRYGDLYTRHDDVIREFSSFVSPDNATGYSRLRTGDLVLAASGETAEEIGKAAIFLGPEPALAAGDTIIFRPRKSLDPLFLGYASNSPEANAHKMSVGQGSSVVHIYVRDLKDLELSVPPLPEQQKIAAILSSIDDAIAATRKAIEQTKRVKQGLLQTFMTRGIEHTRFKNTELGEIPETWEVLRLEALGRRGTQTVRSGPFGSSLKGEHFTARGRPVLTIQSLGEGRVDDEGLFFVSPEKARELKEYEVRTGDLVFSRVADIGRSVVIEGRADGWIISSNLIRLSPDNDRVNPRYMMYCIVGGGPVTRQIERLAGDHGRPVVSSTMLKGLRFPVPPKEEQDEVVSRIEAVEHAGRCSEETVDRLNGMKRGLMQDLLTGRVRVQPD